MPPDVADSGRVKTIRLDANAFLFALGYRGVQRGDLGIAPSCWVPRQHWRKPEEGAAVLPSARTAPPTGSGWWLPKWRFAARASGRRGPQNHLDVPLGQKQPSPAPANDNMMLSISNWRTTLHGCRPAPCAPRTHSFARDARELHVRNVRARDEQDEANRHHQQHRGIAGSAFR